MSILLNSKIKSNTLISSNKECTSQTPIIDNKINTNTLLTPGVQDFIEPDHDSILLIKEASHVCNESEFDDEQSLKIKNYLSEFSTAEQKRKVLQNLGVDNIDISWGNIKGSIEDQADLKELLEQKSDVEDEDQLIGLPSLTDIKINELKQEGLLPNEYISISSNDDLNGEITNNIITTSKNGTYIDILFQAIRSLQSEVAKLKNTFYYGIQSYNGTDTASSNIILNNEQEEKEPLWAMDPEDLSEFQDYSVIIGPECKLQPIQNLNINSNYIEIYDQVNQDIDLNFEESGEVKQCIYIIADIKKNSDIKLNFSGDSQLTLSLVPFLTRSKCNILVVVNRKTYDEDTELYYGKNYIWIQITDQSGNVINTGYINNNSLSNSEVILDSRYYINSVNFSNINLYKCSFYSKQSSFTNDDVLSSLTPNEQFTFKAAHITIRSVATKEILLQLQSRLMENELVLVESESQLYIKNKNQLISLSSKSTTDNTIMTSEQILNILKEAGYITDSGNLDSAKLNAIEELTFIHTESNQKFNLKVNSDGKLIIDKDINITPDTWGIDGSVNFTKRGAVGHYNLGNNDYEKTTADGATAIYGVSNDPKAKGDRVRFGSWYTPIKNQSVFGCSHDFIELANSGSDDYPLENARLFIIKGDIESEEVNNETNVYLVNASIHKFTLTGIIKAGSTYLIRGLQHQVDSPVINVNSYDYELRDSNKNLFSLEGTLAMVLLNASNTSDIALETDDNKKANNKLIYYFNKDFWTNTGKDSFNTTVRCDLIDCVGFNNADAFRVSGNSKSGGTQALGSAIYKIGANQIVKDFFELDPSRQGFLSLTTKEFESTGYRLNKVNTEVLNLNNHTISFPHSDEEAEIARFTPKASYENKTICTDKTPLDTIKPNMVSCFYGINMQTTRCFNWVSVQDRNEYVWIRKKGDTDWNRFESYKGDSSEISDSNDSFATDYMNRVKYTDTVINSVYKRMKGKFPGSNYSYTAHKCVVYIQSAIESAPEKTPITYEYIVGVTLNNGLPNLEKCSNIQTFTLYPSNWTPIVYHISDQQGFEWTEYQVWAASAKKILEKINQDCNSADRTFPVLLNSGDCTQNGTRYNEWLDYYNAGYCLFDHLEQMNVVGNNDLANAYDHSVLGTGNDEGKSNPYYFHLMNCYELDDTKNYSHTDDESDYDKSWQHPLIYNNIYFPSTYYTYFGDYGYIMINSELTIDTCRGLYKALDGELVYNLYTGYLQNSKSFIPSTENRCFKNTISEMLGKLKEKRIIANCHEMPFTVITEDNLSVGAEKLDRSCNGNFESGVVHTSLVGSHLNRIHFNRDWDEDDNYWFSQLLQNKGVKLCIGGHKHSYTCTYPIYENPTEIRELIKNKDLIKDYNLSKLFVTISNVTGSNNIAGSGSKALYLYENDSAYYPFLRAKQDSDYSAKAVTYFMVQATGYKLKSNKELPSANQTFSKIRPNTELKNNKLSAHFSQESPMFATIKSDANAWNIDLYRIVNIKKTDAIKITEFSSVNYSTKPMVLERLILSYDRNTGTNKNYWYTEHPTSDYRFDYKTEDSDRCWGLTGTTVSTRDGNIDYTNYTLTVSLS